MQTEEQRLRRAVAELLRRASDFEVAGLARDELEPRGFRLVLAPAQQMVDQLTVLSADDLGDLPLEDIELVQHVVRQVLHAFDDVLGYEPARDGDGAKRDDSIERVQRLQLDVTSMLRVVADHREDAAAEPSRRLERSLAEQLGLNEIEIERRLDLLGLAAAERELLGRTRSLIVADIDRILAEFCAGLTAREELAAIIGDRDTLRRFEDALRAHVVELFAGEYGDDYVNRRLRIGVVQCRIGVEPKHHAAGSKLLQDAVVAAVRRGVEDPEELVAVLDALDRLLHFDAQLVLEARIATIRAEADAARVKVVRYAADLERKVAERTKELRRQSSTDALTGLSNERAFAEEVRMELARARRMQAPVSCVCLELDGLKAIGDRSGHAAADDVLRRFGQLVHKLKREVDRACRYGAFRFCLLLPNTPKDGASTLLKRLRNHVVASLDLELSAGVVQAGPVEFCGGDELIDQADRKLNQVEQSKRDVDTRLRGGEQAG